VDKQYNPWWRPPSSPWAQGLKAIPPGAGNPLGTRWMGLSASGVGIHGTPDAASIGYSASHGCIRMHISDAEWLFGHVDVGTPVYIT
jgi:lipoprotein-anchoring transpeptidase ErfK/SrfK